MDQRLYLIKYTDKGVDIPTYALYDRYGNGRVHFSHPETLNYLFHHGQISIDQIHSSITPPGIVAKVAQNFKGVPKERFEGASLSDLVQ